MSGHYHQKGSGNQYQGSPHSGGGDQLYPAGAGSGIISNRHQGSQHVAGAPVTTEDLIASAPLLNQKFMELNPHISAVKIDQNPGVVEALMRIEWKKRAALGERLKVEADVRQLLASRAANGPADMTAFQADGDKTIQTAQEIYDATMAQFLADETVLKKILE